MAWHKFEGNRITVRYKGGGDSSSETEPWEGQQWYLKDLFQRAHNRSYINPKFFPDSTVAQFTPEQLEAQQRLYGTATGGSALLGATNQGLMDTIQGKYLDPNTNPWLKKTYQAAYEQAMPGIDTGASQAGRYGGGAWGQMRGRTAADLATGIYGGNYQTERGRQMGAMQFAPSFDEQYRYGDIGKLAALGAERQAMNQANINDARQRWEFKQNQGWNQLYNYRNLLTGDFGGNVNASGGGGK